MVGVDKKYRKSECIRRSWYFENTLRIVKDPVSFLGNLPKNYGPIVKANFIGKNYFVLQHPDCIQHVLLDNHRQYSKPGATKLLRLFLGEGLSTSNGELWLRQRRIMQPAFHKQRLGHILNIINEETALLVDRLHRVPLKSRVNLSHEFLQLTISIISRAMFSTALKEDMVKMVEALDSLAMFATNWMRSIVKIPISWPTPANINFRNDCAVFDEIIFKLIEERRKYVKEAGSSSHGDLLDMLLDHAGEDDQYCMSEKQLRDEVATMFMAGHETTAQTLGWIFYHLAKDKEIKQKLVEEAGTLECRVPSLEDLPLLSYTKQVVNEGLRFYPPIWALVRTPFLEDVIRGIKIPGSSYVLINIYGMHHHPDFWATPGSFNPEHFNVQSEKQREAFSYLPFGGGPRFCIGNNFAMMVLQVVVSRLSCCFEFDVPPGYVPAVEPNISLRSKGGIQLILAGKA